MQSKSGLAHYVAPEILDDESYDTKSDLWALGCILYELCTLKLAFPGGFTP
jgi:NIMA (never in mitosis gene a)-related kinase